MTKNGRLTLFDKIWRHNLVKEETPEQPALLYVGLHLLHEITAPQAFAFLAARGLEVRRPDLSLEACGLLVAAARIGLQGRQLHAKGNAVAAVESVQGLRQRLAAQLLPLLPVERRPLVIAEQADDSLVQLDAVMPCRLVFCAGFDQRPEIRLAFVYYLHGAGREAQDGRMQLLVLAVASRKPKSLE